MPSARGTAVRFCRRGHPATARHPSRRGAGQRCGGSRRVREGGRPEGRGNAAHPRDRSGPAIPATNGGLSRTTAATGGDEPAHWSVPRPSAAGAEGALDGKNAAASTARRNRTILANAMDYAIELGLLEMNPIRRIKWTMPKVSSQVDRRSVVNPRQARALLEAVRAQQPSGRGWSPSSR
jgi:hypothetical protein